MDKWKKQKMVLDCRETGTRIMYPFPFVPFEDTILERPKHGNHIMASYDEETIVLYTTCPSKPAYFAHAFQPYFLKTNHAKLGDVWELRTSFASAVHKTNWGKKPDSECILGLSITKTGFEELLKAAVKGKKTKKTAQAEYFWEVGRDVLGAFVGPSNLVLFVRGDLLVHMCRYWIVKVHNMDPFMKAANRFLKMFEGDECRVPREKLYALENKELMFPLRLSTPEFSDIVMGVVVGKKASKYANPDEAILARLKSYGD